MCHHYWSIRCWELMLGLCAHKASSLPDKQSPVHPLKIFNKVIVQGIQTQRLWFLRSGFTFLQRSICWLLLTETLPLPFPLPFHQHETLCIPHSCVPVRFIFPWNFAYFINPSISINIPALGKAGALSTHLYVPRPPPVPGPGSAQ